MVKDLQYELKVMGLYVFQFRKKVKAREERAIRFFLQNQNRRFKFHYEIISEVN